MDFSKKKLKNILSLSVSNNVFDGSATLTFYLLFATFPIFFLALQLGSALYINNFSFFSYIYNNLPKEINTVIKEIAVQVSAYKVSGVWGFLIVFFSLWSVLNAISAVMRQFNKIYKLKDTPSSLKQRFTGLKVLLYFIVLILLPYSLLEGVSLAASFVPYFKWVSGIENLLLMTIKNITMILAPFFFSAILFKIAVNKKIKLKQTYVGAGTATILIIIATKLFGYYIASFTDYSILYGGLGAAMLLITWLYILSYALMVGCVVNFVYYGKV